MKILNLYAGIGGNRKLWGNNHDITAVEFNPEIAAIYHDLYPDDSLIIDDAHQYLLEHYHEFDFIWSSPPCQTHSSFRQNICVRFRGTKPVYPDMKLYQEIIFLKFNFKGWWVIENVKPYYRPLIPPNFELQRHLFWANFLVPHRIFESDNIRKFQIHDLYNHTGIDLSKYKIKNKRQILRNCVFPEIGLHILNSANNYAILEEQRNLIFVSESSEIIPANAP
jgi:DNA (cytosine-5)-methyltransferase 1